jgi:hypothetical protein
MKLASTNRRSENIRALPIVISELELGNIEWHIFPAHFVERADNSALEDRPETLDGLSVDCADDILPSGMVNGSVREIFVEPAVSGPLIGAKQADFVGNGFSHKSIKRRSLDVCDHARNHIPLAADGANNRLFAGPNTTGSTTAAALIPMSVFSQAADESFIDFDNSTELINILHKCDADAVAHIPGCFQRTEAHITPNLASAYPLFASQHQMNNAEPIAKRLIRVLEYCSGNMGKAVTVWRALFTLPMPFAGGKIVNGGIATTRATNALRPAARDQVRLTGIFVREQFFELRDGQLVDLWRLFCAGHGLSSECEGTLA